MNVVPNLYICPIGKKSAPSLGVSQIYMSGTIANSQRTPTKISKNGTAAKVRILVEKMIL